LFEKRELNKKESKKIIEDLRKAMAERVLR
jgi:hypothetical protein